MVIVRLVVLVPVVTGLDPIEVARLSRAELVVPPIRLTRQRQASNEAKAQINRRIVETDRIDRYR